MAEFRYEIVKNPEIFQEMRLPAHSDHRFFIGDVFEGESDARMDLNGTWKFCYALNYEDAPKDFYQDSCDLSSFGEIPVPSHVEMQGYGIPTYVNMQYPWDGSEPVKPGEIPERVNPVSSYVRFFELPSRMQGSRIILSFQGVESGFAVWLNGRYIGYSEDSFTPSEFDITGAVREGENRLAVQVFKWTSGSWCEGQDFYRFSGIFRDVFLYAEPPVHVRDLRVRTLLDDAYRNADLELEMALSAEGFIRVTLSDGDETVFETGELSAGMKTPLSFHILNPKKWSAEEPHLYDLRIDVSDLSGAHSETVMEKVGFRRFEIRDHVMCLNGRRIVFKGVNRHEFSCKSGRVITSDITRKDLLTMKRNNINAIRTSHYPNQTHLYRLADELGLYVIDETNLETHGVWDAIEAWHKDIGEAVPGDRPEYLNMVLDRARSMYERDKNHPCILIWSCGNESYGGKDLYEISAQFRRLDPTRLVHYEGIFHDRRYPDTSDMESTMYVPVQDIRAFLAAHRDKPYINCEYTHAMGNSCGAMHKYTDLAEEDPLFQGGFIWDYVDQCISLTDRHGVRYMGYGGDMGDRPNDGNFSGNGIVYGSNREPSPKMQEVRYNYRTIRVSFCKEAGRASFTVRNRNLFVNTDRYDCVVTLAENGETIREQAVPVKVAPLSEAVFPLPFDVPEDGREYTVTVSFRLKEDTPFAEAGYEMAYGQAVFGPYEPLGKPETADRGGTAGEGGAAGECGTAGECGAADASGRRPEVVRGWHNIGVRGDNFEMLFSLTFGGPISYKYKEREMIKRMPLPNFWRSMTDNDRANHLPFRAAAWKSAGTYADYRYPDPAWADHLDMKETKDSVILTFSYGLPVKPELSCRIRYEVFGDGEVRVTQTLPPSGDVGELPEFSTMFVMDADYNEVEWYGLGPDETYADRCHAKLGLYRNKAADNLAQYLVPQECGNKVGVRFMKVTDESGHGLMFTAIGGAEGLAYASDDFEAASRGLHVSVLPYTPDELDAALHANELPPVHQTIVRIGIQMGVGGDDTWGAPVHPEYLIQNAKELSICYSFRGI